MESELLEVFQKAVDAAAAAEEERCLDALKLLKRLPITKDVLLSTKIGRRLRPLTKNPRKSIQAMAADVLKKWKGIFLQESGGNGNRCDHGTVSKSIKEEKSMSSDPNQQEKRGIIYSKPATVPPRPRPEKQTNEKNPRDKIREDLAEALGKVAWEVNDQNSREEVSRCDPHRVAAMVEDVLCKTWGLLNVANKKKYRSLLFNINDPNNPDFRRRVLLGQLPPESIVLLSTEDMASDARRLENEKIREKTMFDCELVKTKNPSSGMFKCPKCRKDQTTYHEMQTRRADEPMTAFVECLNCSHHWRS